MNVELNEDEQKLIAVIECALDFVHNLRPPNKTADATLMIETMHQRGWELTHGLVALKRDEYRRMLREAETEIIYLRQEIQEMQCQSPA